MTGVEVAVRTLAEECCPVPSQGYVLVQQADQVLRQFIISALEIFGGALALLFTVDLFGVRTDFAEQDAGVVETEVRVLRFSS